MTPQLPKRARIALYVFVFVGGLVIEVAKGVYGADAAQGVPWFRGLSSAYSYVAMGGGLVALSHLTARFNGLEPAEADAYVPARAATEDGESSARDPEQNFPDAPEVPASVEDFSDDLPDVADGY